MSRARNPKISPLASAAIVFAGFYLFLKFGIGPLTDLITGKGRAPLPSSLIFMYMVLAAIGILVHVTITGEKIRAFITPLIDLFTDGAAPGRDKQITRTVVLTAFPLLVGLYAYASLAPAADPPADLPGIHFDLPEKYLGLKNPLPWTQENIHEGGVLFVRNCAPCHGDALDGNGPQARSFLPRPANFRDEGTIAQLDEIYLFWRIKEGYEGLPVGSIRYRSAMPPWRDVLTDDEIWKIIMFEYTSVGKKPAKR